MFPHMLDTTLGGLYMSKSNMEASALLTFTVSWTSAGCSSDDKDESAMHFHAAKTLSLVPRRHASIPGPSLVVCFHAGKEQTAHDRDKATRTLAVLSEHQQSEVIFCQGLLEFSR